MFDLANNVTPKQVLAPVAAHTTNSARVGTIIDRAGYESLTYLINIGAITDGSPPLSEFTVLLEHGDESDLSDGEAVPDSMLIGTEALAGFTGLDDGECRKLGYIGDKRYTRLTITPSNNVSAYFSAIALLGHPRNAPTDNPPA